MQDVEFWELPMLKYRLKTLGIYFLEAMLESQITTLVKLNLLSCHSPTLQAYLELTYKAHVANADTGLQQERLYLVIK